MNKPTINTSISFLAGALFTSLVSIGGLAIASQNAAPVGLQSSGPAACAKGFMVKKGGGIGRGYTCYSKKLTCTGGTSSMNPKYHKGNDRFYYYCNKPPG